MAQIVIVYRLSEVGRQAALRAGVNAGEDQAIILNSPDYEASKPPAGLVAEVTEAAKNVTEQAAAGVKPDLGEAIKGLAAAVLSLTRALDPATNRNVTTENATPSLWALACKMANTTTEGVSSVTIAIDEQYGTCVEGYDLIENKGYNGPHFLVKTRTGYKKFDAPQTASDLLLFEKARRDTLEPQRLAANAEVQTKNTEWEAAENLRRQQGYVRDAKGWLSKIDSKYLGLPEVERVALLVEANDGEALSNPDKKPQDIAEKAVTAVKMNEAAIEKKAWIAAHGSERLKRLVAEGVIDEQGYRDERLAAELPGWVWGGNYNGHTSSDTRHPTLDELQMLDEARKQVSNAKLSWVGRRDIGGWRPSTEFLGCSACMQRGSGDAVLLGRT